MSVGVGGWVGGGRGVCGCLRVGRQIGSYRVAVVAGVGVVRLSVEHVTRSTAPSGGGGAGM